MDQDRLYKGIVVAGIALAFLAGELEVHDRLWPQIAAVRHDFAAACRRQKDKPWVGAPLEGGRRPASKTGLAATKPSASTPSSQQAGHNKGGTGRERSSWQTLRDQTH
jgi:hypothetical protein